MENNQLHLLRMTMTNEEAELIDSLRKKTGSGSTSEAIKLACRTVNQLVIFFNDDRQLLGHDEHGYTGYINSLGDLIKFIDMETK